MKLWNIAEEVDTSTYTIKKIKKRLGDPEYVRERDHKDFVRISQRTVLQKSIKEIIDKQDRLNDLGSIQAKLMKGKSAQGQQGDHLKYSEGVGIQMEEGPATPELREHPSEYRQETKIWQVARTAAGARIWAHQCWRVFIEPDQQSELRLVRKRPKAKALLQTILPKPHLNRNCNDARRPLL